MRQLRRIQEKVGFDQVVHGKPVKMPKAEAKTVGKSAKTKPAGKVAPKMKSVDGLVAFRKAKYGS